jgi:hypothetical protein
MNSWKEGDRARVVSMSEPELFDQVVIVARIGGFGIKPDMVPVMSPRGMRFLHADELVPVDSGRTTR